MMIKNKSTANVFNTLRLKVLNCCLVSRDNFSDNAKAERAGPGHGASGEQIKRIQDLKSHTKNYHFLKSKTSKNGNDSSGS